MDERNESFDEWKRKRANEYVRKYRNKKKLLASLAKKEFETDEMKILQKKQRIEEKLRRRKELAKERARRYRERKRISKPVKELERNGLEVKFDANNDNNKTKFCLWPRYDSLAFLIGNKTSSTSSSNDYKLTPEEHKILKEVTEYDTKRFNDIKRGASSSPDSMMESSSVITPVPIIQISTDESNQYRLVPTLQINPTSNTLYRKTVHPETTNTLCEPPPLRVFTQTTNTLTHSPPPFKKFKPTPENPKQTVTSSETENEADLHFFKSLLPFMRALPLEDRLRVRTGIQDLILGELEAIRTTNDVLALTSVATTNVNDPLAPKDVANAESDEDYHPDEPVTLKEECEFEPSVTVKEEFDLDPSVTVKEEFELNQLETVTEICEPNPLVKVKEEVEDDQYFLLEVDPNKTTVNDHTYSSDQSNDTD